MIDIMLFFMYFLCNFQWSKKQRRRFGGQKLPEPVHRGGHLRGFDVRLRLQLDSSFTNSGDKRDEDDSADSSETKMTEDRTQLTAVTAVLKQC